MLRVGRVLSEEQIRTMGLFLVRNPDFSDDEGLLAWENTKSGQVFSYVPNLGDFRFNAGLTTDWRFDDALDWEPVDAEQAREVIAEGRLDRIDRRIQPGVFERFKVEKAVPIEEAIPESRMRQRRAVGHAGGTRDGHTEVHE